MKPEEQEPEAVRAYVRWYWDCPGCGLDVCEDDIEPSGVMECPECGEAVRFE